MSRRAVFLDRDGVINENRDDYVTSPEQFRFLPGALDALAILAGTPFALVVVTNQSAVGRGRLSADTLRDIHDRMLARIDAAGGRIDAVYTCVHRPEDGCLCRKPQAGLLYKAASDLNLDLDGSYFIGDAASDVRAALVAGCQAVLVETGQGQAAHIALARDGVHAYQTAGDLAVAVDQILAREAREEEQQRRRRLDMATTSSGDRRRSAAPAVAPLGNR
jgi:D-glycero-D-manno-heptose 1,7-bisphosphate phosphatase